MGLDATIVGVLSRFRPRQVVLSYLVFQALAIAGWWVLLIVAPASRICFFPEALTGDPLMSFWLADLGLLMGGSLLAAWLVVTRNPAAPAALWFLGGAFYYPALYCMVISSRYGGGEFGVAAMFTAGGLTLAMTTVVGHADTDASGFRVCSSSRVWAGIKTLLQILVFWMTFFIVLPSAVAALQDHLGVIYFDFSGRWWFGLVIFVLFGALGLTSACWTLVVGRGTPLPTDCAPELVVTGPYRSVRNPMALAGITQGIAVGVMWGSWPIMLYAFTGALVWHWGARPMEEADLSKRFGASYEQYRKAVRCWVPVRPRRER